ncbi:MAG: DNA primase [bacterium]|nr:DNA primase [bacterium]
MAFYGDDIVERVREASDIVDVISAYLPLKRKGRNYWARCPFHQEKTASFSVSPDKQIFHCFGCHKGGNVFSFIIEYEKLPFPDALKLLAARANVQLPEKGETRETREFDQIYWAHEVAMKFFQEHLLESRKSLEYLKSRKLTDATIEKFKIGYAPDSWDAFLHYAKQKSLTESDLEKAGLVIKKENGGYYDRFRDRLVFTIFNTAQKPIAFGARTFDPKEQAKYINSPETPLYHKASILYGLSHSRGDIRRAEEAIVVEGYFDFLSLYQQGVTNVVASSGTAFTPEQARLLGRSASSVILMFDADSAGQQAAIRSVDYLFEAGLDVKVVKLPAGEDPDSIARKGGKAAIDEQLARAKSYVEFTISTLPDRFEKLSLNDKDRAIKRLATLAGRIEDEIRRELFLQEIARWYNIGIDLVRRGVRIEERRPTMNPRETIGSPLDRDFVALLLQRSELVQSAAEKVAPTDFEDQTLADIYSLILQLHEDDQPPTPSQLIDKVSETPKKELIAALAAKDFQSSDLNQVYTDLVIAFHRRHRTKRMTELKRLLKEAETENDEEQINYYMNEIKLLRQEL